MLNLSKYVTTCSVIFVSVFVGRFSFASSDQVVQDAIAEVGKGSYGIALQKLHQLPEDQKQSMRVQYWRGLCSYKLQNFGDAVRSLETVVNTDTDSRFKDAPYMLGQSYYALQNFRQAAVAFQTSLDKGYMKAASLYYLGYVNAQLGKEREALDSYNALIANHEFEDDMKQAAQFQIGELSYGKGLKIGDRNSRKNFLLKSTIPAYEKVMEWNQNSPLATQAGGRIADIRMKLNLEIPKTKNGSPVPAKAWMIRFTQDFKYDSNIVNQADGRILAVANTGAPYSKTGVFGKYEWLLASNQIAITPELAADATFHARRSEAYVYSNDNTSISPALRTRTEHRALGKAAAFLGEYEFSFATRDYSGVKQQKYYSATNNFVLGERIDYLKFGSTTLKINLKLYENANIRLNYWGPGLSLGQNWKTFSNHNLNTTLGWDYQITKDGYYDQKNYKLNLGYAMPALFWKTNVDISFAFAITNVVNQTETRGIEKNISPGITFTKTIDRESHWAVNANYTYTKNISSDTTNYAYDKHVVGIGGSFTF